MNCNRVSEYFFGVKINIAQRFHRTHRSITLVGTDWKTNPEINSSVWSNALCFIKETMKH